MDDSKRRPATPDQCEPLPNGQRRRLSRVVHDHKGNASVVWQEAPADYERPVFEIEGARQPQPPPARRPLNTGSLAIQNEDTFNPYARVPDRDRKAGSGRPRDLRKLSAWIKLMRQLEESKRNGGEGEEE